MNLVFFFLFIILLIFFETYELNTYETTHHMIFFLFIILLISNFSFHPVIWPVKIYCNFPFLFWFFTYKALILWLGCP